MKRGADKLYRRKLLLEMADAVRFHLRGLRELRGMAGMPLDQKDAACLNLSVAIQNLEEAAARFGGNYRIRAHAGGRRKVA